jgi:hypothetical protein
MINLVGVYRRTASRVNKPIEFVLKILEKEYGTKFLSLEQTTEMRVVLHLFSCVPIKDYCNMELQILCELFRV